MDRSPYIKNGSSPWRRERDGNCFYGCGKYTVWYRLRHGIEVPVCYDCCREHRAELSFPTKKHLLTKTGVIP
jgi:hypothetical protein